MAITRIIVTITLLTVFGGLRSLATEDTSKIPPLGVSQPEAASSSFEKPQSEVVFGTEP